MNRTCKKGTIKRRAFTRKSSRGKASLRVQVPNKKLGTRSGAHVKAACIKNVGAPGKWRTVHRSAGIGTLKKGRLERFGYDSGAAAGVRHAALRKAAGRLGSLAVFRMLGALSTYTKRTSPGKSAIFKADRNYVRRELF